MYEVRGCSAVGWEANVELLGPAKASEGSYSKGCQVGGHDEVVGGCGRALTNFLERSQGKSWSEKVGQNKKVGQYRGGESSVSK